MAQQYGLGRGLASLIPQKKAEVLNQSDALMQHAVSFGDTAEASEMGRVIEVAVEDIVPNPFQPRLYFSEDKLFELSESIKEHGILQPLIVTKNSNHRYELIAGERRFQAAKLAQLKTVPVIVREAKDQEKFELAIIENVQRHDLNAIEEAKAYRKLIDEFGMSQEVVAKKMGKSRSAIANTTRLLQLPVDIQRALIEARITEGHAKALLSLDNSEKQRALFEGIIKNSLTVRESETKAKEVSVHSYKRTVAHDPVMREREERLMEVFGTKVKINKVGQGGRVVIEYYDESDFTHLLNRLIQ
jgi:ParB family chromosome partitioning protein